MKARLVPVTDSKALQEAGIFYTKKTLRKMHCIGELPEIFVKIRRRLFINLDAWDQFVNEAISKSQNRAKNLGRQN